MTATVQLAVSSVRARTRVGLPVRVYAYVGTLSVLAVLAVVPPLLQQLGSVPWLSWHLVSAYAFAVMLFAGELRPLFIARFDGETDQVSVSATFAVALVLTGPLVLALAVQLAASATDDLIRRRRPATLVFNAAQYVLTLAATRLVFTAVSGHAYLAPISHLKPADIPAALLAGLVYFAVNNAAVGGIRALATRVSLLDVLREDVRVQGLPSSTLLGLAPVAAVLIDFSPLMLPLLVIPLIGVQRNAWIAAKRQHEALHDGLTGLPNRTLFSLRATRAVEERQGERLVAVMLLDLDHFKEVNDTLGHQAGDDLLREVARRLTSALPPEVTVARLGGDEFAVLVADADSVETVVAHAEAIAENLRAPVLAEGVRLSVQGSIGIALCPLHADSVHSLLQRADIALYRAKANRGDIKVYHPASDEHTVHRLALLGDLHAAVVNDEMSLVFQPQVDATNGQVVAVEALMRWSHPVHGTIAPDVFIPLAENSGLIAPMSRTAVALALATLAALRAGGLELEMAVNISARQLSDLHLPQWIGELLMASGVPAPALTIEVTEGTIAADPQRAMQVLNDLRTLGVRLSIDDFGTGYSSLSYLQRLQPDELKVDKSFVLGMGTDENNRVIVSSTVELAHALGLSVVAEGVEDAATYAALRGLGCDRLQGFHIARPMSAAALTMWLATRTDGKVPA